MAHQLFVGLGERVSALYRQTHRMAQQYLCGFGTWEGVPGPFVWGKSGKIKIPANGPVVCHRTDDCPGFSGRVRFLHGGSRFILHYRKDVAVAVLCEGSAGVPEAP